MVRKSKNPLVSVIVPSYNHERYIGEAIESVLRSTMQDFEIIVVDDGSVDNSVELVKRIKDPRVMLFEQPNGGAHAAINRGTALSSAPWIAILNSDDRYHDRKLQRHLQLHEKNPSLEASASGIRHISGSGVSVDTDGYINWRYAQLKDIHCRLPSLASSLLVANHLITTSALFVSRQTFNEVGGFIPLRYVHDWFFFLTLASRGKFAVLEEVLVDYRVHGKNTIRENDHLGRIEDNFVLEWHIHNCLKETSSASDVIRVLDLVKQNKRTCPPLMLLFQLWRTANDNDLAKCAALFQSPGHPLIELALKIVREEYGGGLNLKTRARRLLGERLWAVLADYRVKQIKLLSSYFASLGLSGRK